MKHPGEENHSVWTAERKNQAVPLSKMQCKYKKLSNPLYFLLLLQMIGQQDAKLSIHTEHCSRLQILHLDLALLLRLLKQFFYNRHQFFAYFNRKLIVKFLIFCTMKNGIMILSILVDTFSSRISLTMPPSPKPHNTACVLS